jgi:hypothetical protein
MSDQDKDQERPLFQGMDEYERTYAPEELPADDPERLKAESEAMGHIDEGSDIEPPSAAPVGTLGTSPSGAMAPPTSGIENTAARPATPKPRRNTLSGTTGDGRPTTKCKRGAGITLPGVWGFDHPNSP